MCYLLRPLLFQNIQLADPLPKTNPAICLFPPYIWALQHNSGKRAKPSHSETFSTTYFSMYLLSSFSYFLKKLLRNLTRLPFPCPYLYSRQVTFLLAC